MIKSKLSLLLLLGFNAASCVQGASAFANSTVAHEARLAVEAEAAVEAQLEAWCDALRPAVQMPQQNVRNEAGRFATRVQTERRTAIALTRAMVRAAQVQRLRDIQIENNEQLDAEIEALEQTTAAMGLSAAQTQTARQALEARYDGALEAEMEASALAVLRAELTAEEREALVQQSVQAEQREADERQRAAELVASIRERLSRVEAQQDAERLAEEAARRESLAAAGNTARRLFD